MGEINNEFVSSVKKENNLGCYRLHTIWKDDSFRINIVSKDASWTGEMTPENVEQMSNQLQQDSKTYLNNCKEALTVNDGKPGVSYMVENGSFVWKMLVDEDAGIQIKMGAIPIQPSNFVESIQKVVDVALTTNKQLQNKICNLNEEKDKLTKNNDKLFLALDEAKKCKIKMENDLYEKFIELLNSKKKMILDLQNKLENKEGTANVETRVKATKTIKPPPQKKKRMTNKKPLSDVEAYDVDTENDSDEDAPVKSQRRSARLSAKISPGNSQEPLRTSQDPLRNNQEPASRKRTVAPSEPKNNSNDIEINVDSDSTISDEELYNIAKSVNEKKIEEVVAEEGAPEEIIEEVMHEKTNEVSPQKTKSKYIQPSQNLLKELWG